MVNAPIGMPVEHAEAFRRILSVTRRAWRLQEQADGAGGTTAVRLRRRAARQGRGAQLARLAARAFEAQVMALRCREAFVGQSG